MALHIQAQTPDIREIWKSVPQQVVPYLTETNKLDFLDFMDSKMAAKVHNALNGESEMTTLNSHYLKLALSKSSTMEMYVMPVSETLPDTSKAVVCVVKTVGTDVQQSTVDFYSQKWHHLFSVSPTVLLGKLMQRPDTMSQSRYDELEQKATPVCVKASLSPTEPVLYVNANSPAQIEADKEAMKLIFKQKSINLRDIYVNKK
jgi:hypothetical protein